MGVVPWLRRRVAALKGRSTDAGKRATAVHFLEQFTLHSALYNVWFHQYHGGRPGAFPQRSSRA